MVNHDFDNYLASLSSIKFRELWPEQSHILKDYEEQYFKERDVGIELPTGTGKTLIALLIAGVWIKSEKKAVILSANKTLSRQMRDEAEELGLPVAYMEGRGKDIPVALRRAYQRAQKIGIMNYWVYFNQNPIVDPADLVVMDDAHLAEHCMHSLYSIMITRKDHEDLFGQIVSELFNRFPEYAVLANISDDSAQTTTPAELLSFVDHDSVIPRIKEIIDSSPSLGADLDLKLRWGRLRDRIHTANLYIARHALWLRPYVYPLVRNEQYKDAKQVIYMSATIGDPGDLSRRLGVGPIRKIPVPVQFADRSSGRRLIVMNRTNDDSDIPRKMSTALLQAIRLHPKSLWLCSSENEASKLRDAVTKWLAANDVTGHRTWMLTSLGDEIDQFRQAPAGHLFVGGRFDGMDFNGDQCRIVVMSTIPKAINLQEEFISAYLRDSGFMRSRLNQRIVQGLGRCTRNSEDFGVYFLADQRFATHFARESNRDGIPRHMMGELDLAQDLAEVNDDDLTAYVARFLKGDFQVYDTELDQLREDIPSTPQVEGSYADTSGDEVIGWAALFKSDNYHVAQKHFERCWNSAKNDNLFEIAALHGWHRAKALYLDGRLRDRQGAVDHALEVLESAIRRGGQSSWFNRMRASISRARNEEQGVQAVAELELAEVMIRSFDDKLERLGATGPKFQRAMMQIGEKLKSERHGIYQEGLELLGALIGYQARRPKHGAATDCTWRGNFGNSREVFTFEAKIEQRPSSAITVSEVGQAAAQHNRALLEYEDKGYAIRSLIVTHLEEITSDGESSLGQVRLVSKDAVVELWRRVCGCMAMYRSCWSADDIKARRACATEVRPRLPKTGWLLRAADSADLWVSKEALLDEWNV